MIIVQEKSLKRDRTEAFEQLANERHDVLRFAKATAKRIYKDHETFKKDHDLGAFDFVHG